MTDREADRIREQATAAAKRLHPEADAIRVNPRHDDGPIVEVWHNGGAVLYRFTGFSI